MKPPENIPLIRGAIADYWLSHSGILYSYSKNSLRTVKNISENVELVKTITQGRKVPLLIYLCNTPVPDKETRKFSATQLPIIYKAMALVSKPGLSRLLMNILFRLKVPPIPIKSFSNDNEALDWLEQFL